MGDTDTVRTAAEGSAHEGEGPGIHADSGIPAGLLAGLVVVLLAAAGIVARYYVTSLYWVSFFVAHRQARITRGEMFAYIGVPNAVWVFMPAFGLYVSIRLILEGSYGVLG